MASEVCLVSSRLVSDPKGGNVCGTSEEGEIVIKEEMEDEAPLVNVQIKHENDVEMKPNVCQDDSAPFLAGNLLPVTITEEGEEVEVLTTIVNPASTSTATPYLYKCHLCPAAFTHYQITREHIRGHSLGCRSYVCPNCQQAFYSKSELSQHQLEHSNCHQALLTSGTEEPSLDQDLIAEEVVTTASPHSTSTPSSKSGLQSTPNNPPNQLIKEDDDDEVVLLKSPTSQLNLNSTPPPTSTQTPKKGRYQCSICSASFSDSATTLEHIRGHFSHSRRASCPDCKQVFYSKAECNAHQVAVHGAPPEEAPKVAAKPSEVYTAPSTATITMKNTLTRHLKDVLAKEESATSSSPCELQEVKKKKKRRFVHRCTLCPRTFTKSTEFTSHLLLHQQNVAWKCEICGALYPTDFYRRKHQEEAHLGGEEVDEDDESSSSAINDEPANYTCPTCPLLSYTTERSLRQHIRLKHPGTEPLICPQVSGASLSNTETYTTESNSIQVKEEDTVGIGTDESGENQTVKEEEEEGPRLLSCLKSPLTYARKANLGPQVTTKHSSETQRELSIIPAVSGPASPNPDTQAPTDQPHDVFQVAPKAEGVSTSGPTKRKAKPDATPITCPACQRTYANSHTLRLHTRIKHPEPGTEPLVLPRRHLCPQCNKAFPSPSHLADHTRSRHTGERPYGCVQCDYRAPTRKDLLRHVRRGHADAKGEHRKAERPVACPQCPRGFKGKAKMAQHVKEHHEGNSPWRCDVCGALFGGKRELSRHRSMEHGEPLPKTKKRKVEVEEEGEEMDEMDEIAVFQELPEVKEEFEDEEEEIVFCKTIK